MALQLEAMADFKCKDLAPRYTTTTRSDQCEQENPEKESQGGGYKWKSVLVIHSFSLASFSSSEPSCHICYDAVHPWT